MKRPLPVSFEKRILAITTSGETVVDNAPMRTNYPFDPEDYFSEGELYSYVLGACFDHLYGSLLKGRQLTSLSVSVSNVIPDYDALEGATEQIPESSESDEDEWYGGDSGERLLKFAYEVNGVTREGEPVQRDGESEQGHMFNDPYNLPDDREMLSDALVGSFGHFWTFSMEKCDRFELKDVTVTLKNFEFTTTPPRHALR